LATTISVTVLLPYQRSIFFITFDFDKV